MFSTWDHGHPKIDSHQEPTNCQQYIFTSKFCKYEVLTTKNTEYLLEVEETFHCFVEIRTHNLCVGRHLRVPLWYQCVLLSYIICEVSLLTERTDYRSNLAKTILFDILDFWCQLVVIRFVKTLSKRRMFVLSMKISACWLLHRWIKFNKICWEKRPAKTRPNLRTSFCRRDFKNT